MENWNKEKARRLGVEYYKVKKCTKVPEHSNFIEMFDKLYETTPDEYHFYKLLNTLLKT